jgi:murein DD-endopeptidase MepM/ murein hydrolase activator NlpD
LANPYLPLVAKSAARYGVPADLLAALIHQESGFQPGVSSGAGAEGIAQFMPGTWSGSWNPFRSQSPFNAQAAIPAAALYLSRALATNHGNVSLALASYNAGQGAVNRYHGVPPYSETQNYVRTILSGRGQFPGLANGTIPSYTPVAPNARQSTSMAFPETPQASALTTLPNPAYQATVSLQDLIQSNAQNAGIPSLSLPLPAQTITEPTIQTGGAATPTVPPASTPSRSAGTPPTRTGNLTRPLATGRVIGFPYQGSHKPGATTPANWESDNAIDISVPTGTPVYAAADGTIGSQIGAFSSGNPYTAGLRVHLATRGNEFYYGHLSRLLVHAGQQVHAGQIIGYSGSANGVQHLHFAARNGNPVSLFGYGRR